MKSYRILPRPIERGGGWSVKFYKDGEEMGGGVFPPVKNTEESDFDEACHDAVNAGQVWIIGQQPESV